jgi:hypothetical protein
MINNLESNDVVKIKDMIRVRLFVLLTVINADGIFLPGGVESTYMYASTDLSAIESIRKDVQLKNKKSTLISISKLFVNSIDDLSNVDHIYLCLSTQARYQFESNRYAQGYESYINKDLAESRCKSKNKISPTILKYIPYIKSNLDPEWDVSMNERALLGYDDSVRLENEKYTFMKPLDLVAEL